VAAGMTCGVLVTTIFTLQQLHLPFQVCLPKPGRWLNTRGRTQGPTAAPLLRLPLLFLPAVGAVAVIAGAWLSPDLWLHRPSRPLQLPWATPRPSRACSGTPTTRASL
jgi:hypothetical protein